LVSNKGRKEGQEEGFGREGEKKEERKYFIK
jgi:hypothetical protein